MSRAVIQLVSSVQSVVIPEIGRAFAAGEARLLRTLHRQGCQVAFWLSLSMVALLALFAGPVLHVWTSGKVGRSGLLLYLFLVATVVDSLWYTSLAVLYATNRHQRVAVYYMVTSLLSLPLAYALLEIWGLSGAAVALLAAEVFMLFPVLHQSLPAAQDGLRTWLRAVVRPPRWGHAGLPRWTSPGARS
jgi:O-antigen/teichoic acid export membrane protein